MRFFGRRTKGSGPFAPEEFQSFAVRALRERFGSDDFTPDDDVRVVRFHDSNFGLESLFAIYQRDALTTDDLRDMVVQRFERLLGEFDMQPGSAPMSWDEARELIRPQFMPASYLDQAPAPLAHEPLSDEVAVGIVFDLERTYSYVRGLDLEAWGKSYGGVLAAAAANLNAASAGMEIVMSGDNAEWLAIEMGDGYDAARLLVPEIRRYIGEVLGFPFRAGIPNRDFLVCWSLKGSSELDETLRVKIREDFTSQPYALTPSVLIVTPESLRVEQKQ